ncbi:MAG: OmpA family protein [Bradymonadia bacterium]
MKHIITTALLLWGAQATAQGANTRSFVPRPSGSPTLTLDGTAPLGYGGLSASLWTGIESQPLIFYREGDHTADIVTERTTLDAAFAVGVAQGVDLGLVAPMVLMQSGRQLDDPSPIARFAFGDPRFALKSRLLDKRVINLGLALTLAGTLPLGDADALTGEPNATGEALLAFEVPLGHRLDLLVNTGARFREPTTIDELTLHHEWLMGFGASWRAFPGLAVSAEVVGRTDLGAPFAEVETSPVDVNGAVRISLWHGLSLTVGGGLGVQAGYGAPAWRGMVGIEAAPRRHDFDGDALADGLDRCITVVGVPERDGCPAPVVEVETPTEPEAPVIADRDGDGLEDAVDECPEIAEDADGFRDTDGCPDPDNDLDGIADVDDGAPLAPEDFDGFADNDGVPDLDDDDDGVLDVVDACPEVAGPENGCPAQVQRPRRGPEPGGPLLLGDTLHPASPMRFEFARATLHAASADLLDGLADFLNAHPDWGPVEVGVHTDALGSQSWKRALSIQRAAQVRAALVARGVPAARLTAKGYGPSIPVASNETREGRYRNRRVELRFLQPPPVKTRDAAGTGPVAVEDHR